MPVSIKTDNRHPLQRPAWENFLQRYGIHHRYIAPLWPKANSQAEGLNKPLIKAICSSAIDQKPVPFPAHLPDNTTCNDRFHTSQAALWMGSCHHLGRKAEGHSPCSRQDGNAC